MNHFKVTAPVAFFTFNRIDTTRRVFERIREAKPQKLYLISDGARETKEGEADKVNEVRSFILNGIDWDCCVKTNFSEKNLGCRNRINSGIDWVFESEDRVIILEDDVVPSLSFFRFCQDMLEYYADDENVFMITGNKRVPEFCMDSDYIFSRYCSIWGWATWKRAWIQNDQALKKWPRLRKEGLLKKVYGLDASLQLTRMIDLIYEGKLNTWDYPWQLSKAEHSGLEVVPSKNLVENIGMMTEDATHHFDHEIEMVAEDMEFPINYLNNTEVNEDYDSQLSKMCFHISPIERAIRILVPAKILRRLGEIVRK